MTVQQKIMPAQRNVNGVMVNEVLEAPFFVDSYDTIPKLFRGRCLELGDRTALREKKLGIWESISWSDYYAHAKWLGLGLVSLGLERGDVVSVLCEDRKEWLFADMGIQSVGAIVSGVYTTDAPSQVEYLVKDSGSRFVILENDEQLDKYLEVRDRLPSLSKVIVIDRDGLHDLDDPSVLFIDDLYELGRSYDSSHPDFFDSAIEQSVPTDTAILVYTSGTTGNPKGAMITHSNILFSLSSTITMTQTFPTDEQICFLPLCHILERLFSSFAPLVSCATVNFAESPQTVFENLREVRPHTFVAVPRVWEKIYSQVILLSQESTGFQRWSMECAVRAGRNYASSILDEQTPTLMTRLHYIFWDFLVLRNMRRMLGLDRIRRGGSGAAPIAPDLLIWFHSIGVPLFEGYGMTESAGVISINTVERHRPGSVGNAVNGAEVRIAPDGEIQYRAPNVFVGYWNLPDKTSETLTSDGWLRTGDVGRLTNEGFLEITGRLKDIIITAGGKNIAPAPIENRLKFSPYISDAVVVGDNRKFLGCLVMIDYDNVEQFAQARRIPFSNYASLCAAREVRELVSGIIDEVNQDLAQVEQIKKFRLIDILLTAEDDELTPTMKLKRSFIEEKYSSLISEMYSGAG